MEDSTSSTLKSGGGRSKRSTRVWTRRPVLPWLGANFRCVHLILPPPSVCVCVCVCVCACVSHLFRGCSTLYFTLVQEVCLFYRLPHTVCMYPDVLQFCCDLYVAVQTQVCNTLGKTITVAASYSASPLHACVPYF